MAQHKTFLQLSKEPLIQKMNNEFSAVNYR